MVLRSPLMVAAWVCLLLSLALLQLAPLWMPVGYSAFTHSISESAAQAVPHAAWARGGLLLLGGGAVLAALSGQQPPRWASACLIVFGLAMVASAIWSHRPWWPEARFDARADRLHSLAAQVAGMAFVAATGSQMAYRWKLRHRLDALDAITATAAVMAPLAIAMGAPGPGAAQRVMFVLATVWLMRYAVPGRAPGTLPAM